MCFSGLAKIRFSLVALAVLLSPAVSLAANAETPAQKAERMKWWVDARFGMFIHWGPVSLKGTEIGWSRGRGSSHPRL